MVAITDGKPLGFKHIGKLQGSEQTRAKNLLRLFGGAPEGSGQDVKLVEEIGPTRLAFWDCSLSRAWVAEMNRRNLLLTETKMENMIDRIQGVAAHGMGVRNTERVPAGASFEFTLTVRVHDGEDLLATVYEGLKLLELTGLGGSGSRGYGKVKFKELLLDKQDVKHKLDEVRLDEAA